MEKITREQFFLRCKTVHNNKYSYDESQDIDLTTSRIKIQCPVHGEFTQRASSHWYGGGCRQCGRQLVGIKNSQRYTKDTPWFIQQAQQVHGDKYDYSLTHYTCMQDHVKVICLSHGEFNQLAQTHVRGSGCPRCASAGRSKGQDSWLDTLGIPNDQHHRNVRIQINSSKWLRADGFKDNTFYEFWGDWAHGNPELYPSDGINKKYKKTYGQLYAETLAKRELILTSGFSLVEIWESEWIKQQPKRRRK